ncbi:TPA: glycerol-3-phosphate 1-O-acyltransferase PlsY [Streptococcus suis]
MQYLYLIFAYLLGSIPTGVWYSRLKHNTDVRHLGSGNSGATNVGRNFGLKAAVLVTVIDVVKGIVAIALAKQLFPNQDLLIMGAGIAAVIGHAYPIFAGFKGGKIVATSFGVMAGFQLVYGIAFALLLFIFIYLSSTISLSAMAAYFIGALYIFFVEPPLYGYGFLLISLFMCYRHRQNLVRLFKGTESRIGWGLRNPKKKQ